MKIKYLLTLLFLSLSIVSSAQQNTFPKDSAQFLEQLGEYLERYDRGKARDMMEKLRTAWGAGIFNEEEQIRMIDVSNALLDKRAKASPHFMDYLNCALKLKEKNAADNQNYDEWEKALLHLANNESIRTIGDFLETSVKIITSNTLYKSRSTEWVANTDNYAINFNTESLETRINFDEVDLTCYAKGGNMIIDSARNKRRFRRDSINILNTSGSFSVIDKVWYGKGGKVTWARAGYSPENVYAEFDYYSIDMTKYWYEVDTVTFVNANYFAAPLKGHFEEKVMHETAEDASYPRFSSFDKRLALENILDSIDYIGGFRMEGAKFIGEGTARYPALLKIHRNKQLFVRTAANHFVFRKDKITALKAEVSIYLGKDSIYHPGLLFKFLTKNKEMHLFRNDDDMSARTYTNTYHNLKMDFQFMTYQMGDTLLVFRMLPGMTVNKADFQSSDYFSHYEDSKLQYRDEVNPLIAIKRFINKMEYNKYDDFRDIDLARYMRKSLTQIRRLLSQLAVKGFVIYDFDQGYAHPTEYFYTYLDARAGKEDYDVITFHSETGRNKYNAVLNLNNFDLDIKGVRYVRLSDVQNVFVVPNNRELTVKENRDFVFDGGIKAGLGNFFGEEFYFQYDSFKIDLKKVDSIIYQVRTDMLDEFGEPIVIPLASIIEKSEKGKGFFTGDIRIDHPENKSGEKKSEYPQYPIFNCQENSYVFYDKNCNKKYVDEKDSLQKGVYPRDTFYFEIYPYTLEQLDSLNTSLALFGRFTSGGILPGFEDTLIVQDDYSLGFIRTTDEGGVPVYGGKGTYHQMIKLSNQGLEGGGKLDYLTSSTWSKEILFYPDSMTAHAYKFRIEEQKADVEYPKVVGDSVAVLWRPYDDFLTATKEEKPMEMYGNDSKLHGTVKIEPKGTSGWGDLKFRRATVSSELYKFNARDFTADKSDFDILSSANDSLAFAAKDLNTRVNFDNEVGIFKSNNPENHIEFPQNLYSGYIKSFNWDMDKTIIESNPANSEDYPKDRFVSQHKGQDSLQFEASSSTYDLFNNLLSGHKVEYINIADAVIYPTTDVVVEPLARIRKLKNAEIVADREKQYHKIFDANVNIYGKNDYKAGGSINYVDEFGDTQVIGLDTIMVDDSLHTYAHGYIPEERGFKLSPYFAYNGKVELYAQDRYLTFEGRAKINHDCDMFHIDWFSFRMEINPDSVYIPFEKEFAGRNRPLYTNVFLTNDSAHIYSAFLSLRKNYSDNPVFDALKQPDPKAIDLSEPVAEITDFEEADFLNTDTEEETETDELGEDFDLDAWLEADSDSIPAEEEITEEPDKDKEKRRGKRNDRRKRKDKDIAESDTLHVAASDSTAIENMVENENETDLPEVESNQNTGLFRGNNSNIKMPTRKDSLVFVYFDKDAEQYQMSNIRKLKDRNKNGNFISLDMKTCDIYAEGQLDFGVDMGQVKLAPVGNIEHDMSENQILFDLLVGIEFFMPDKCLEIMAETFIEVADSAVNMAKPKIRKGLDEYLDTVPRFNANTLLSDLSIYGEYRKFPEALEYSIFFNDLKMRWFTPTNSYRSVGKIGVGSILDIQINKFVDGYIEIIHKKRGDIIEIYLAADNANWFYFSYTDGLMQAVSSDEEFNETIDGTKEKDRKLEVGKNEPSYKFGLSSTRIKSRFIRRFEADEEEY